MKYKVTYLDEIEASSIEEAYEILLSFLGESVNNEDLTPFAFVDENGEEF
jgi:hypothetical protein